LFFYQQTKIDATSDNGDKPQTVTGDIEFDNITFTYPARQEAPVCFSDFFCPYFMINIDVLFRFLTKYHLKFHQVKQLL